MPGGSGLRTHHARIEPGYIDESPVIDRRCGEQPVEPIESFQRFHPGFSRNAIALHAARRFSREALRLPRAPKKQELHSVWRAENPEAK
jgi:hypothetical protein